MELQRFEVPGLAHYSYLLASNGKAVVIDPKRDIATYLDSAGEHNLIITHSPATTESPKASTTKWNLLTERLTASGISKL